MADGWLTTTLGEVVALRRGHDLPAAQRKPGKVPVVGSGGISGWHDQAIQPGPGVVLGRATNLGRPYWVPGPYWPLNTSLYVTDFRGNDPRYVFHLFEVLDLSGYNSGSVQPMLNRNYIQNVPIDIPPLPMQRRIADVLGVLDDLIETNLALAAACEDMSIRLVEHLPVSTTLGAALTAVTSAMKPHGVVDHYSLPAFDAGRLPVREAGSAIKSNKIALRDVSLLISRLNPHIPRSMVAYPSPEAMAMASTEFAVFQGERVEFYWAVCAGPRFRESLCSMVTGTTGSHQRVDKQALGRIPVPDASIADQGLVGAVTALVRQAHESRLEGADLKRARDELLPLLMSGQVVPGEVA